MSQIVKNYFHIESVTSFIKLIQFWFIYQHDNLIYAILVSIKSLKSFF